MKPIAKTLLALLAAFAFSGCGPEDQAQANRTLQNGPDKAVVETPPVPPAN